MRDTVHGGLPRKSREACHEEARTGVDRPVPGSARAGRLRRGRRGALPAERVVGVETGGCPHTAIREDASANLEAVHDLLTRFPGLELLLIESGGDNLAATFSPELVDAAIYVIDVAEGEKIPRKGGPGITRSDLLVINKIDLAPHVGADLAVMDRDARRMRGERPFVFTNLKDGVGVDAVVEWIRKDLLLASAATAR